MSYSNLTENEKKMLVNLLTNDYNDFPYTPASTWSDCWDCGKHREFVSKSQASGIISSLSKKDLVNCSVYDKNSSCIEVTSAGVKAAYQFNLITQLDYNMYTRNVEEHPEPAVPEDESMFEDPRTDLDAMAMR